MPSGGDGLYHFIIFFRTQTTEFAHLQIRVNDVKECEIESDNNNSAGDSGVGTCSVTKVLAQG